MKTKEEIFNYIETNYPDSTVTIFDSEMGEGYYESFIGITDTDRAVYDYDGMVSELVDKYMASPDMMQGEDGKEYTIEDAYTDAMDWISFNTFRALPYEGSRSPIIVTWAEDYEQYIVMAGLMNGEDEITFTDIEGKERTAISEERFCREDV